MSHGREITILKYTFTITSKQDKKDLKFKKRE